MELLVSVSKKDTHNVEVKATFSLTGYRVFTHYDKKTMFTKLKSMDVGYETFPHDVQVSRWKIPVCRHYKTLINVLQ